MCFVILSQILTNRTLSEIRSKEGVFCCKRLTIIIHYNINLFHRHWCGIKVLLNWSKRLINLEPKRSVITYYLIKRKIAWQQFLSWRFLAPPDLYRAGRRHGQYSTWVTHNIVHQAFIDGSGTGNHDCVAAPHGARALYCCLAKGDHDNPFSAVRQTDTFPLTIPAHYSCCWQLFSRIRSSSPREFIRISGNTFHFFTNEYTESHCSGWRNEVRFATNGFLHLNCCWAKISVECRDHNRFYDKDMSYKKLTSHHQKTSTKE